MLGSLVPQRVHIHYYYGIRSRKTIPVMALGPNSIMVVYMMQGCHTPSPPHPMVCPLACQVGSCLVWLCCFPPSGLVWPRPLPPCRAGLVVFLVGPAPPVRGSVFYRGMVWLLPLVSSNVIVTCLVPSPRCGRFGWPRPACVGQCVSTEVWYGCCRLLAVMSSLRARYHTKYDVALFSLQTVPLSLL